jgi:hypothetical protein
MPTTTHDFRLFIHQQEGNHYQIHLLESPAGETPEGIASILPHGRDLDDILTYTQELLANPDEQTTLGQQLFAFLFPPNTPLRDLYQRSLGRLDRKAGDILRLILQWDEKQTALHQLPWEYLHDGERFLAHQRDHSLVRWLPVAHPLAQVTTKLPLRLLLVTAVPTNQPALQLEQEISQMQSALADLIQAQQLELTILPQASPMQFREAVLRVRPHLLHFAGHGYVRAETGEAGLYFRGETGLAEPISAEKLAVLLSGIGLQMVVLGACHTAVPLGVAHALVKVGVTAVLGMQYALSNQAGFRFARTFYRQLAQAATPETALNEARHALAFDFTNQNHWAVPVLFLRTRDRGAPLVNLPYTPAERARYLAYLATEHGTLTLPGGQKVPLEQLYVSLRADPLNAAERQAENKYLHLQAQRQLEQQVIQLTDDAPPNQRYQLYNAFYRGIARDPLARLMELRDAPQLFGERRTEELSLAEVVTAHDQLIILGDPGSGKTTLGRWLVTQFAHALQSGQTEVRVLADMVQAQYTPPEQAEDEQQHEPTKEVNLGPVRWPIFIRIGEYAAHRFTADPKLYDRDTGLTLGQFIERGLFHAAQTLHNKTELTPAQVGALADEAWRTGRALLVLDGLDEVGDPDQRRLVMEEVQRFSTESAAGNKLVLTSRLVGYLYAPLTHLPHYSVEAMGEDAIRAFSQAWFTHVGLPEGQSVAEATTRFAIALFEQAHPGVRTLAGNPLLLTILVQVFQNQPPTSDHPLPVRRADLFRQAEQAFYDQRRPQWRAVDLTLTSLRRALGRIAFYIHTHSVTGLVSHEQVWEELLTALNDDERQAEAVLQAARDVSGFLVARGEGVYAFLHRGLQEYFVACHLTDKPSRTAELITPYILDPTWQEPLALAVGLLQPGENQSKVLRRILETPDPVGVYLPRRELAAVAAIQECALLADESVAAETASRLIQLYGARMQKVGKDNPLRQRLIRAWRVLVSSAGHKAVERAWLTCVDTPEFASRWGAVELLIEAEWFTLTTVRALLRAWRTHEEPTPTASIFVALDLVAEKQPTLLEQLTPTELPFRQRMVAEPERWADLGQQAVWRILVRLWYLPPWAAWEVSKINRDSPLTPHLWAWLDVAPTDSGQLRLWLIAQLQAILPTSHGMVQGDLLTGLAGLGDLTPQHYVPPRTINGSWWHIVRALALDRGRARALDLTLDRDLDLDLTLACDLDLAFALDRNRAFTLAYDLDRDLDPVRILAHDLGIGCDLARLLAPDLAPDLAHARDLAHALAADLVLARALDLAKIDELDSLLIVVSARWQVSALTTARHKLSQLRAGDVALWQPLWGVVTAVINQQEADPPMQSARRTEAPSLTLSLDSLPQLIRQLTSREDKARQAARNLLQPVEVYRASALAAGLLVALAEQALAHQGQYGVDTQIAWGLNRIDYDGPAQLVAWFQQATGAADCPYTYLLSHLHRQTEACLAQWHHLLPHPVLKVNEAVLQSLRWQTKLPDFLQTWLQQWYATAPPELQPAILQPLIDAADNPEPLANWFAAKSAETTNGAVRAELLKGLARQLARLKETEDEASEARLRPWLADPAGQVAWVRYFAGRLYRRTKSKETADHTVMLFTLQTTLPEAAARLTAVIAAGTDDAGWAENYHALLVKVGRDLILQEPDTFQQTALQQLVLRQYETALQQGDWPERRFLLALLAALLEQMPQAIQNEAAHVCAEPLETLLVRGAQDAGSFNSRRFALSGLSYLRRVTPTILPVLTAGFLDVDVVQEDALTAVCRFRSVEGEVVSHLAPYLMDESLQTARAVGQLLGVLGRSSAGERTAGLRDEIITVLVAALADERSQREVRVGDETKKLEDIFYEALLGVAGWGG